MHVFVPHVRPDPFSAGHFSGVSGFTGPVETHVTVNGHVSMARGNLVSGNFFSTLGVRAFAGRSLGPMDDLSGAPPAVMLSYGYWQNRFGGDPSIVGKSILLEHSLFLVAGVVGPGFSGVDPGLPTDIWAPLSSQDVLAPYVPKRTAAKSLWVEIIARLKPGVPIAQAQSALDVIFVSNVLSGVGTVFKTGDSPRIELLSVARGLTSLRAQFSLPLFVLMAAVGIVLLIASANIGGLSLARAMAREQEMAVRLSLGATRARIVRQLLTESLLLAMLGTVLGILIAYWSASSLAAFLAANWYMPLELDVRPDGIVLGFTIAVALLTTLLFGLAPAVQSLRVDLAPAIKRGGKTLPGARGLGVWRFGFGSGLVVAQVGLSIIVLAGAGLLVHTLVNLETLDVGFDTHHVLLFRADSSLTDYKADRARILYRELQDRLAALPGVTSASYSMVALLSGAGIDTEFALPATPDEKLSSDVLPVGQHFFETMHVPLLAGRTFVAADLEARAKPEPVVVNEALAKALFGKESPLGRQFIEPGIDTLRVIVGVVRDARYTSMRREPAPTAYVPLHQDGGAEFELRTAGDPRAIASAVRAAVNEVAPNILISDLETQTDQIEHALYQERLFASLSALFSALALLLACIGIYGLLSYEVTRRTHEIGVRMALGAAPRDVLRLVFRRGLLLVTMGTVMGVAAAVGLTRYLQSLLYGIRAVDPFTYACAVILLAVVALAACWIPARRAMRVDPMVALRYE